MKTVFLFIPNYVFSFDLLKTKYIEYLSSKYKVIIFLPTLENIENYYKSSNIEYVEYKLKHPKLLNRMKLFRIAMIKEFDNLLSIKLHYKNAFHDFKRIFLRVVAKVYPFNIRAGLFTKLERSIIKKDKEFENLLEKYKPEIVLTCTPGFTDFEAEAIILSNIYRIKTAAINFSWNNLTTNAKHIRKTDFLVTWNDIIKKEAIELHRYDEKNVFVSGIMRFDYYFDNDFNKETKEEFLIKKNLDPKLKILLLTTTSHGVYPYHRELIKILLDLRDDKRNIPDINIFIRIHPKDSIDRYAEFENIKNLHIETAGRELSSHYGSRQSIEMDLEDFMNLKNTLKFADIAVNYTSTITLEAFVFDKPVINIGFPEESARLHYQYRHYQDIVNLNSVKLAKNTEDLETYINLYYKNPEIDKESRLKVLKLFVEFLDNFSYKRNVDFLEQILLK